MKRILGIGTVVLLGAAMVAYAAPRKSVLKNGSFEQPRNDPDQQATDVLHWTDFEAQDTDDARQSTDFAFDRQHSALASVRTGAFVGLYQDTVTVTEFTRILMTARAYQPSSAPISGNIVAGIKLEFDPPEGVELPPPEENLAFDVNAPLDTWVPVTLTTTVPPDVDLARIIVISFDTTSENGFVFADSAWAERSSAPGVNQLDNASFELGGSGPDGMNPPWDEFADALSGARKNCFNPPAHDGSCTLRIGGFTAGVAQQIVVAPGETLTIRAFFKSLPPPSLAYNHPDARAGVKVEWVAGTVPPFDVDVVPNPNPQSGTTNIINSNSPRDQWVPISIDYTMPDNNAARLRATVINAFGPGVCDVYFDAFEMVLTNVFNGSDADGDNDEDMLDIAQLQQVFADSGGGRRFGGLVFDHDEDNDVDITDANFVLDRMTGPSGGP